MRYKFFVKRWAVDFWKPRLDEGVTRPALVAAMNNRLLVGRKLVRSEFVPAYVKE